MTVDKYGTHLVRCVLLKRIIGRPPKKTGKDEVTIAIQLTYFGSIIEGTHITI